MWIVQILYFHLLHNKRKYSDRAYFQFSYIFIVILSVDFLCTKKVFILTIFSLVLFSCVCPLFCPARMLKELEHPAKFMNCYFNFTRSFWTEQPFYVLRGFSFFL